MTGTDRRAINFPPLLSVFDKLIDRSTNIHKLFMYVTDRRVCVA
ncbi:hypothetical protein PUN28_003504 [Cardiocondyla obscurior]|uniref:Uncharacterized protein n=1 Tax=Cardiocondyla obscurior TaxID=286306 RepID=A0AAW2GMX3_9HYME